MRRDLYKMYALRGGFSALLNEFVVLERGLTAAGLSVVPRHPDVQSPGKSDAVHVRLDQNGVPVEVAMLLADQVSALWTLRNGKHNSFPYLQLKKPLLSVPKSDAWHDKFMAEWKPLSFADRRGTLHAVTKAHPVLLKEWETWPGSGLTTSLQGRYEALKKQDGRLEPVLSVIARFLQACHDKGKLFTKLAELLLSSADVGDKEIIETVCIALCGRRAKQGKKDFVLGSPLYFDVARDEFSIDVACANHIGPLSEALRDDRHANNFGTCDLTGEKSQLHVGNFPQPTLPVLGQVYLFAKNEDIRAAHRYGRFADGGIHVGSELIQRLAGALNEITAGHRKGQTWRSVPSEKPGKNDLLLAFVDQVPDIRLADAVSSDEEDESNDETAGRGAAFLTRTERVVDAIRAKVGADFRKTPVTLCVLRKVDLGNAKVILHRAFTVGELYDAAKEWGKAQSNVPDWLKMPVRTINGSLMRRRGPNIAPASASTGDSSTLHPRRS